MDSTTVKKGFIVKCDTFGKVAEVKQNNLFDLNPGEPLTRLIDPSSLGKFISFLKDVDQQEGAIGWEVNIKMDNRFGSLFLAGVKENDYLIVIGTTDVEETRKYYNNLMVMNNYQQNQLREALKENVKVKESLRKMESLEQMTQINNQMANLQRELSRKNKSLNELNIELEGKNEELDRYAHIVSHDLKAPLIKIQGLIQIITAKFEEEFNEELKDLFSMVNDSALKMNTLINDILEYSKAGRSDVVISTFSLSDLMHEVLSTFDHSGYKIILPEELPEITGSYIQLSQVLSNLSNNAVKYHDKPAGSIEIQVKDMSPSLYEFSVTDDGPGIPEKYHQKIFDVFETAHGQNRLDSTGVGLAIVKKLVEKNGGKIGLQSTPGQGTTFWFTWPKVRGS